MTRTLFLVGALLLAAATPVSAGTALLGTWGLNGGEPRPNYLQTFTITKLTFRPDGTVLMRYLPQPPVMFHMMSRSGQVKALAPKQQSIVYVDRGNAVELAMGSDLVTYRYEIRGSNTLLLTMPGFGGGVTKIYRRMH
jgi:hypothetical protein